jgi:hypothetical protein
MNFYHCAAAQGASMRLPRTVWPMQASFRSVDDTRLVLNSWLPPGEASFILPLLQEIGNGKTTVTQMMASILNTWKAARSRPEGNFNNDIGAPLTLLRPGEPIL